MHVPHDHARAAFLAQLDAFVATAAAPCGICCRPSRTCAAATAALVPGAVRFQGQGLPTGDFLATWAVELAVHHLDLDRDDATPAPAALRLAREPVEALAGGALPAEWPDDVVTLLGTGRVRPSPAQIDAAPPVREFPVLG